jgi:uncharacterized protein (TIGR02996 family)
MTGTGELEALLRACKANPTDDDHRRVLADWLEEHGQHDRAEFIRLQLAGAAEEGRNCDATAAEREARTCRLLRKNVGSWLGGAFASYGWSDVPGPAEGATASVKFERGLAHVSHAEPLEELPLALPEGAAAWLEGVTNRYKLDLDADGWRELCRGPYLEGFSDVSLDWEEPEAGAVVAMLDRVRPAKLDLKMEQADKRLLRSLARLEWFRPHVLSLRTFEGWDELAASEALSEVRRLDVRVSDGDALRALAAAPHLGRLRQASVSGEKHEAAALGELFTSGVLSGVEELSFCDWKEKASAGLAAALRGCRRLPTLRRLRLTSRFGDAEAAVLAGSPVLEGVRELNLASCEIPSAGARALLGSPSLAAVESLGLSTNRIGDDGARALAESPHLTRLRALDVGCCMIQDAGVRALAASPLLRRLESLDLSRNAFAPELLAAAGPLPNLRRLGMRYVSGHGGSWQRLFRSPTFDGLVRLWLTGFRLGPEELAALAGCSGVCGLRELDLAENDFGEDGARALADAGWLDRLLVLNLRGCRIGDDGLIALLSKLQSGALAKLNLCDNDLGPRGGRALLEWPGLPHLVGLSMDDEAIGEDLETEIAAVIRRGPP